MKRLFAFLLVTAFLFSGCTPAEKPVTEPAETTVPTEPSTEVTEESTEAPTEVTEESTEPTESLEEALKQAHVSISGAVKLTEEELQELRAWYADPNDWNSRVLLTKFQTPREANLSLIFYNGGRDQQEADQAEREYYESVYPDQLGGLPLQKVTKDEMEDVLEDYLDLELEQSWGVGLGNMLYWDETEAFYQPNSSTNIAPIEIQAAYRYELNDDLLLLYNDPHGIDLPEGKPLMAAHLRKNTDGNYTVFQNIPIYGTPMDSAMKRYNPHGEMLSPEEIQQLQTEFGDPMGWPARFLIAPFPYPEWINFRQLCYSGIPGLDNTLTETEIAELTEEWSPHGLELDVYRLPTAEINAVLEQYLGLSIEDTWENELDTLEYLEETDSYYISHGDTNAASIYVHSACRKEDGTVVLYYCQGDPRGEEAPWPEFRAGLLPTETGYQILYNLPTYWPN